MGMWRACNPFRIDRDLEPTAASTGIATATRAGTAIMLGPGSAAAQASAEDSSKRARDFVRDFLSSFLGLGSLQYDGGGHAHPCFPSKSQGPAIECLHLRSCHYWFRPSAVLYLH